MNLTVYTDLLQWYESWNWQKSHLEVAYLHGWGLGIETTVLIGKSVYDFVPISTSLIACIDISEPSSKRRSNGPNSGRPACTLARILPVSRKVQRHYSSTWIAEHRVGARYLPPRWLCQRACWSQRCVASPWTTMEHRGAPCMWKRQCSEDSYKMYPVCSCMESIWKIMKNI